MVASRKLGLVFLGGEFGRNLGRSIIILALDLELLRLSSLTGGWRKSSFKGVRLGTLCEQVNIPVDRFGYTFHQLCFLVGSATYCPTTRLTHLHALIFLANSVWVQLICLRLLDLGADKFEGQSWHFLFLFNSFSCHQKAINYGTL